MRIRLDEIATSFTAIVLVLLAAGGFTLRSTLFPASATAHKLSRFPRRTFVAGSPSDHLVRVPAELPSDNATLSIPPTDTLSPTERQLVNLRALRLAPPQYLLDQGITHVPRSGRRVVLTFDDGPSKNTSQVLSILRDYDAKATFFFVGKRSVGRKETLQRVLDQGSEIGNHTWDHVPLLAQSEQWDKNEIERADKLFYDYVGVHPKWVRPQSGWADQSGIDAIESLNRRYVFWDAIGNDTVHRWTARMIADSVLADVRSGSIILLHETNPRTVAALPRILRGLQARGYKVTTMTDAWRRSGQ